MLYFLFLIIISLLVFFTKVKILGYLYYFLPFLVRNISLFVKKNHQNNTSNNNSVNSIKEAAEILGVNPNSSADVIELAYRKLIKK